MAIAVYLMCALLSFACTVMLLKGYLKNKYRLLLWSSVGFLGFAINNVLLFVDLIILPTTVSLVIIRTFPALIGMVFLVYGLISDSV